MPVKLRRPKDRKHRVTEAAVDAYRRGDLLALHRSLGLKPWMPSPLPLSVTALGVDPDYPPGEGPGECNRADWDLAIGLQQELQQESAISPPGREAIR